MSHYYTLDGQPAHTQPTKPGAKNLERPTDIRDARRLNLLPSVTTILEVKKDPGLSRLVEDQIIEACYRCPPTQDTVGEYNAFIRETAFKRVKDARAIGVAGHAAMESFFKNGSYVDQDVVLGTTTRKLSEIVEPALERITKLGITPIAAEIVLVNEDYGYAGTSDLLWVHPNGTRGPMDFKFQKSKPGKSPYDSENHHMQLAAYYQAYWGKENDYLIPPSAMGYNILISTTEVGRVDVLARTDEDLRQAWKGFKAALNLWEYVNGYSAAKK